MPDLVPELSADPGSVLFVGAGPGDPDLLTRGAARALEGADVVLYDRLVGDAVLSLINHDAEVIEVGKTGFGASVPQARINATMVGYARAGRDVVRLKSGDCGIFGRLDEEIDALDAAGIVWRILPGLTSAAAAAASIGQSLTKRGRNGSLRILTGHDVEGFAEQDWRGLARAGEVAAIYMGKKASRFLQGRLLMHGAHADTPVTLVENASRHDERVIAATLSTLPGAAEGLGGPAVILFGLAPRRAAQSLSELKEIAR
jgi:uroporphyrin-III C-methyltransferase